MNGGSLLGMNAFPVAEFLSVQVHEFGHYQNLAHTVVNGQAADPGRHHRPDAVRHVRAAGDVRQPHRDDVSVPARQRRPWRRRTPTTSRSSRSSIPSRASRRSTGTITGRIRAPNNTTPVTGVNVIARNVANPYDDAVSAISSDFAVDYAPGQPFVGVYTLRGLTPGASYAVFVDQILAGGFSTPPRSPLPGPEELYNGAGESNDFVADVPSAFTPVVAVAGVPVTGIDIIFNRLPPGPIPLGRRHELRDLHRLPGALLRPDLRVGVGERQRQPDVRRRQQRLRRERRGDADRTAADRRAVRRPQPGSRRRRQLRADQPLADGPLHRGARVRAAQRRRRRQHLHDRRCAARCSTARSASRCTAAGSRSTTARSAPPTAPPATAAAAR